MPMDQRPSSWSPRSAKVRLAAPVPGASRNGRPGMSNDGSFTPRSLAETESRTLDVRWSTIAPTSSPAMAEPGAFRLALDTIIGLP